MMEGGLKWQSRFVQHVVVLSLTNPTSRKGHCPAVSPVPLGHNACVVAAKS